MRVITWWRCERCGASGSVMHRAVAGVMEVANLLSDAHEWLAERCQANHGIQWVRASLEPLRANAVQPAPQPDEFHARREAGR